MANGIDLVLLLLLAILNMQLHLIEGETRVEVTTPTNLVTVGGILVVQCQIWEIQDGDIVVIARTYDGGSEQISYGSNILDSSAKERVYLAIRRFPDGTVLYFLTLLNILSMDSGEYACTVSRMSGIRLTEIAYDSADVQICSFPDESQPSCVSFPSNTALMEGDMLELTCTTYKTIPIAHLKWRLLSTYEYLESTNSRRKREDIVSTTYVTLNMAHHDAIFRCEMTSEAFPDRMQSCEIGPISVKSSKSTVNHGLSLTTARSKEVIRLDAAKPPDECLNICTSSSETIFYLTVSTAATCFLTIVFIITTCIMCFKHHSVSSNVRQRQRQAPSPPSLASDPVYVSLQRRNTNERVYMTLEDPNNPEGKVLLPKEVFDEFYNRTLTLRKT